MNINNEAHNNKSQKKMQRITMNNGPIETTKIIIIII